MGKSAPQAPDPGVTAVAQGQQNLATAQANQLLNMVNQVTPDGSLTYSQSGTQQYYNPPVYDERGRLIQGTGQMVSIPSYTATQSLSPAGQQIHSATNQAQLNLANLASQQSARVGDLLGQPFDLSGAPARGDLSAVQMPTYNLPQLQTGLGDAGAVTRSYTDDFSADRQRVEDALMGRLNTQFDRDRQGLEQRLADQGIGLESSAYDRAMQQFNQGLGDARVSAVLGAGQEQSRLAGLARDQAQFGNAAQQQVFDQGLAGAQFGNTAQQQMASNANTAQDQQFRSGLAMYDAQNAARASALQEQYAARNQPINEISALMSGSQVANPQFTSTPTTGLANVDYAGLVNQNYQNQLAAYQARQSMAGDIFGGLAGLGGAYLTANPF